MHGILLELIYCISVCVYAYSTMLVAISEGADRFIHPSQCFGKFPENHRWSGMGIIKSGIVKRQNKILIHDLHQNGPTIMPDSPVEYNFVSKK